MLIVAALLSVLIGLSLGILGGGGSILTVPILVYALGVETKSAIATSLLVVGITSAAGAISHARAGRVRYRTGLIFGGAGMVGAYAGGWVARFLPGDVLLAAFALMMLVTAGAMMRKGKKEIDSPEAKGELPVAKVLGEGLVVGMVTGIVGAGGGFLVVPALVLLGGLPMHVAVGTSLLVIAMKSLAGFAGYMGHVEIDWTLAAIVTTAAVLGSVIGGRLAGRIPQASLRKGFAWFVVVMAIFLIGKQVTDALGEGAITSLFEGRGLYVAGAFSVAALLVLSALVARKLAKTKGVAAATEEAIEPST